MDSKNWVKIVLGVYFSILCIIAALVIIVDPYFHFHAPIDGISYIMEEEVYMNDGIVRNFDYDAVITGTSTSSTFSVSLTNELFDVQAVRVSFSGEGFKQVGDNLKRAIASQPDLKTVFWGLDTIWFSTGEEWKAHDSYPEYLYDDDWINDANYVFNGDVLLYKVLPQIERTLKREPAKGFDDYKHYDEAGRENALRIYERPEKTEKEITESETEDLFYNLERNLEENVFSIIEENPDITFYTFFPPYSICWWDEYHQYGWGVVERRIEMERYAIEKLISYENVHMFSFTNNFELICDLDNYNDEVHYAQDTADKCLHWMKEGEYELTADNYETYIEEITDFMHDYDYDAIFENSG